MTSALVTVLGAVCALVGVWGLWMRRTGAPGTDAIHVVTNRYLGGKRFLTLVEVDGIAVAGPGAGKCSERTLGASSARS